MSGWDGKLGTVNIKLDLPPQSADGGTSANGTWTFQNSTPSDARFQNSEPGFGDVAAFSARTYANFAGSIGKQSEIQAPADFARPYQCDLDNSRPGVLAPRLQWQGGQNVTFDNSTTGRVVSTPIRAPADTAMYGMGGIVTAGTEDWLYSFDPTVRRFVPRVQLNLPGGLGDAVVSGVALRAQVRVAPAAPTIRETSGHIYVPVKNGGVIDAAQGYSQTPIQTGTKFWHLVSFGGYIVSFEASDPTGVKAGMTISLRNINTYPTDPNALAVQTPTSLSGIDAAPELGNQPIQEIVPDWLMCHTPVVYGGAIYCCSDRQVLKVVFDDENCRLLSVPIHSDFTRITGNPSIFQGSLFVPSGNTLWKWTPGQLEFTPVPIDTFGDLPANRGGGIAVATLPVAGGLLVTTMSDPTNVSDSALLMMDAQNVFQLLDVSLSTRGVAFQRDYLRICHFHDVGIDALGDLSGGPVVCIVCTDQGATKRVIGRRESNRDPVYLPKDSRRQVPGSHFWVSPVDPGIGYGDLKQALKIALACADVTNVQMIRFYYQTNYESLLADNLDEVNGGYPTASIPNTVMAKTGTWHLAASVSPTALTPLGLTLAGAGYAGFTTFSLVGTIPGAPEIRFNSIRWAVEIISDTSGILFPRLLGFKFYYSETPIVYVVHSLRIRILAGDPDLASVANLAPKTPTDVYNTYLTLWNYAKAGSFQQWLDPNGDPHTVKITKFVYNAVDLMDTPDGLPAALRRRTNKIVLQLALQEADS